MHQHPFLILIAFIFIGSNYYVRILSTIDRELLKPSASVALHKHSNALVDVLPPEADSSITMLGAGWFLYMFLYTFNMFFFLHVQTSTSCLLPYFESIDIQVRDGDQLPPS